MRIPFSLFLLLLALMVRGQDVIQHQENVEKGLTFPATLEFGEEFAKASIEERLKAEKIPGASVAIVSEGRIAWTETYGVKEALGSDPVASETLFQCASIGKVITALAVLRLADEGKVDLNEDVNEKLKRWKIKGNGFTHTQKVTPKHLLSHSAGLTDDYGFLGYSPQSEIPSLLQILNNQPPAKTKKSLEIQTIPGQVERYSGGGYLILQLLIEDVSGSSFSDYIQEHIFHPLGMTHSTYADQPDQLNHISLAAGHRSNGKTLKNKKYNVYPEKAAAGPWTTAEDLAKLILGIQEAVKGTAGAILSQRTTQELLSAQINQKGLGVNLKGLERPEAFWHAGQNLGYTALLYGLIERGEGAVILLNSDGGERLMQEFMTSVAMEYDWPVMQSFKDQEIPKNLQTALTGRYVNSDGSKELWLELEKGVLKVRASDAKKGYPLYRIGDNHYTFKNSQDYYKLSFNFDGNTSIMTYSESVGNSIQLEKVE